MGVKDREVLLHSLGVHLDLLLRRRATTDIVGYTQTQFPWLIRIEAHILDGHSTRTLLELRRIQLNHGRFYRAYANYLDTLQHLGRAVDQVGRGQIELQARLEEARRKEASGSLYGLPIDNPEAYDSQNHKDSNCAPGYTAGFPEVMDAPDDRTDRG